MTFRLEDVPTSTEPYNLKSVSVSQVNTFTRCNRRWFLQKVRGLRAPPKLSAALGVEIHRLLERWFKYGERPSVQSKHYAKVNAAICNLPPPHPELLIEHQAKIAADDIPTFKLVVDLVDPRNLEAVYLVDHKTTSRIEALRASPVDLTKDPQMLTYAKWAHDAFKDRKVYVAHNTISTKHVARVLPLKWVEIPKYPAEKHWGEQKDNVKKMVSLTVLPVADFTEVACNTEACGDYGGCEFVPLCSVKNPMIGVAPMSFDQSQASELLAKLAALKGGPKIVTEAPESVTPALLPPDAPTRETPIESVEAVKAADTVEAVAEATPPKAKGRGKGKLVTAANAGGALEVEYDISYDVPELTREMLDTRARDGWELVGVYDSKSLIFKRKVA